MQVGDLLYQMGSRSVRFCLIVKALVTDHSTLWNLCIYIYILCFTILCHCTTKLYKSIQLTGQLDRTSTYIFMLKLLSYNNRCLSNTTILALLIPSTQPRLLLSWSGITTDEKCKFGWSDNGWVWPAQHMFILSCPNFCFRQSRARIHRWTCHLHSTSASHIYPAPMAPSLLVPLQQGVALSVQWGVRQALSKLRSTCPSSITLATHGPPSQSPSSIPSTLVSYSACPQNALSFALQHLSTLCTTCTACLLFAAVKGRQCNGLIPFGYWWSDIVWVPTAWQCVSLNGLTMCESRQSNNVWVWTASDVFGQ